MKVKKIASGAHVKKFGSSKVRGGRKGGALVASPVKTLTSVRKGM